MLYCGAGLAACRLLNLPCLLLFAASVLLVPNDTLGELGVPMAMKRVVHCTVVYTHDTPVPKIATFFVVWSLYSIVLHFDLYTLREPSGCRCVRRASAPYLRVVSPRPAGKRRNRIVEVLL